jgi:hypothetical protein
MRSLCRKAFFFQAVALIATSLLYAEVQPIPQFALWESNMTKFATRHCATVAADGPILFFGSTYYDAPYVYHWIRQYTEDPVWDDCIDDMIESYLWYVYDPSQANGGYVAGYWNFTRGLREDWEINADATSKQAVIDIATNAMFCNAGDYDTYTTAETSRESAYCLMAEINAEAVGMTPSGQMPAVKAIVLDHLDQWFITKDYEAAIGADVPAACEEKYYIQPFMVGITVRALIQWCADRGDCTSGGTDQDVLDDIETSLDWLWANAWVAGDGGFWYQNCADDPANPSWILAETGDEDLNLLIAPAYWWLAHSDNGNLADRDRGDDVLDGAVGDGESGTEAERAYLGGPKQFNQNYLWSIPGMVDWRLVDLPSAPPSADPITPPWIDPLPPDPLKSISGIPLTHRHLILRRMQ